MTNNDTAMFDVTKVDRKIRVGNGETVKATKMGKIKTSFKTTNGKMLSATLTDVIHVPNLSYNLLSVGKLRSRASVVFNPIGAHMVVKNNKVPFERVDGSTVFGVNVPRSQSETAQVAVPKGSTISLRKAHSMLGHVGMETTKTTMLHWGWKIEGDPTFCKD